MDETVDGLTLEQYARVAVELHRTPESEWDAVGARFGVAAGRVVPIGEEWTRKMTENPTLALAYNDAYQQAMVDAGITAPEVTLEQYAQMIKGGPTPETLASLGIDTQQFSMIMQRMGTKLMSDPALAQELAKLMMPGA